MQINRSSHKMAWFLAAILLPVAPLLLGCGGQPPTEQPSAQPTQPAPPSQNSSENSSEKVTQSTSSTATRHSSYDDKTLWVRPTNGSELDLSGIAEETETALFIRPQLLLATEEGKRFWQAMGPAGEQARKRIETEAGKPLESIERLVVSLGPGEDYGSPLTSLAIEPAPTDDPPLLRRELELLAASLDNDSHLTLLLSPKFLLGDGGGLFAEQWKPLRDLLTDLAGEEWQAASLSLHLGEQFYWELRIVGTAATREVTLANSLRQEANSWPMAIEQLITQQDWPTYSRQAIDRSPKMLNLLAKYARHGSERRQTILNGYLPSTAAHNLTLSGELILAGLGQMPAAVDPAATDGGLGQLTVQARLEAPITLQFRRESLESALQLLSEATKIPITLAGRDLQLEGITRNQMLGLDQQNKPAGEVLVEILRRANPDVLATGAADMRQKLVYVIRESNEEGSQGELHITTRSATKRRKEALPAPFVE